MLFRSADWIDQYVLYRDDILYDERVLYDSEGDEDEVYADRSITLYAGRPCRKRGAGGNDDIVNAEITGVVCTGYFRILSYRFPRPLSCGFFHTLRAATIPTIYRILISIVGLSCKR